MSFFYLKKTTPSHKCCVAPDGRIKAIWITYFFQQVGIFASGARFAMTNMQITKMHSTCTLTHACFLSRIPWSRIGRIRELTPKIPRGTPFLDKLYLSQQALSSGVAPVLAWSSSIFRKVAHLPIHQWFFSGNYPSPPNLSTSFSFMRVCWCRRNLSPYYPSRLEHRITRILVMP